MLITEWDTEKAKEVWYEEGLEEGMEKGIEKGLEQGLETSARNALAEGASIEFAHKITGLDIETIKKLAPK